MKKDLCSTQDYLVSGETFSIRWDESKGFAATHPQPTVDKLGSYYESDAYISHNESQQSVVGFLYRFARKYMFRIKHNMFKRLTLDPHPHRSLCGISWELPVSQ